MDKASEARQGQHMRKAAPSSQTDLYEDMEHMFDNLFKRGWLRPWLWEWPAPHALHRIIESRLPRVDVIERDVEILVKAELPGVEKKDIDVSMTEDAVTIKGSTRHEAKQEKGDYYRSEISRGGFARTVALPAAVDSGKAKASFKDGVLELVIPKLEARKRRAVKIE